MSHAEFDSFFAVRTKAAEAYVSGDPVPLDKLVVKQGDATFHSPRGDSLSGAAEVAARYISDAKIFEPGGKSLTRRGGDRGDTLEAAGAEGSRHPKCN